MLLASRATLGVFIIKMDEIRKKYAAQHRIDLDSVPSIIQVKGSELEALVGEDMGQFEPIGEGTVEDLIEFTRQNGHIEGAILIHYGGENKDSYNGIIFSTDVNHSELTSKVKEAIPHNATYKIKLKGTRKEIADQLRTYIELRKAEKSEKIQEQFQRPFFAAGLPFYIAKSKLSKEDIEDGLEEHSIFFDICPENQQGLHARPSAQVVIKAKEYGKKVALIKEGQRSQYNSPMSMMALYAPKGETITMEINGTDEKSWKAAAEIYSLFKNKFGEA